MGHVDIGLTDVPGRAGSGVKLSNRGFPALAIARTNHRIKRISRWTFFALLVSILGLFFLPWRQTARGTGTVVALDPQQRRQPVLSPAKGIISYVKQGIREGSHVKKGELVLQLTPFAAEGVMQLDATIATIKAKEESAKSQIQMAEDNSNLQRVVGEAETKSLRQEVEAARSKWEQTKNVIIEVRAELDDKENKYEVSRRSGDLISREKLFSDKQAMNAAQAKLDKAKNAENEAYSTLLSKEEALEAKMRALDIKNQEAGQKVLEAMQKLNSIEKELLDAQTKRDEFDRLEVVAPRDGRIQQWFGLTGSDTVKEGDRLFILVPDADELAVEMKVSGNDVPLIREGDPVRLQFEGWPSLQVVGWPSVAVGTFGGQVDRIAPTDDGMGNFSVLVTAENHFEREKGWPDDRYLRQGVRVNGWVLLDRVPLGYEIWRLLNGFPASIDAEKADSKEDKPSKVRLPKV